MQESLAAHAAGKLEGWFQVESTPPCEVAQLAGFLPSATTATAEAAAAAAAAAADAKSTVTQPTADIKTGPAAADDLFHRQQAAAFAGAAAARTVCGSRDGSATAAQQVMMSQTQRTNQRNMGRVALGYSDLAAVGDGGELERRVQALATALAYE